MIMRGLNAVGDWLFGGGYSNYLSTNAAIGLNIETRIRSWVGDCFFDKNAGVDWLNRLGSKNQQQLLENDIRRVILTSYGVTSLDSFSITIDTQARSINAQYQVKTIYSPSYIDSVNMEL